MIKGEWRSRHFGGLDSTTSVSPSRDELFVLAGDGLCTEGWPYLLGLVVAF